MSMLLIDDSAYHPLPVYRDEAATGQLMQWRDRGAQRNAAVAAVDDTTVSKPTLSSCQYKYYYEAMGEEHALQA